LNWIAGNISTVLNPWFTEKIITFLTWFAGNVSNLLKNPWIAVNISILLTWIAANIITLLNPWIVMKTLDMI